MDLGLQTQIWELGLLTLDFTYGHYFRTHSTKAPNTKRIQANIQASIAVSPSALGVLVVTLLKMLTSTRNSVTRSAILPGITSIGMRNEIHETITKRPT